MSSILDTKDPVTGVLVAGGVTAPWWEGLVETVTQFDALFLMLGGGVLLVVRIRTMLIEYRIKKLELKNLQEDT